jgi:hypothetical protein
MKDVWSYDPDGCAGVRTSLNYVCNLASIVGPDNDDCDLACINIILLKPCNLCRGLMLSACKQFSLLDVRFCFKLQGHLLFVNPFTAKVAIMRLLGSAPKSHLCDRRRRSTVTGLSDLMTLYWPRVFILQTDAKSIQFFQKHAKLIENCFSRSKVQLTRVWELLTRRWNAWHWESHCVVTAGGERVKDLRVFGKKYLKSLTANISCTKRKVAC